MCPISTVLINNSKPICSKCEHYIPIRESEGYMVASSECKRTGTLCQKSVDIIDGNIHGGTMLYNSCQAERTCGECGMDGKFYKKKQNLFQKIFAKLKGK